MKIYHKPTSKHSVSSLWIGKKLSRMEVMSINSFLYHNIDFKLYVYEDVENIPLGTIVMDANKIISYEDIKDITVIPWISDYFRYKLFKYTDEIWTDLDIICIKNMSFLKNKFILGQERNKNGTCKTAMSLMRIPSNHLLVDDLIQLCQKKLQDKKIIWGNNGIKIFHNYCSKYNVDQYKLPVNYIYKIDWFHKNNILNSNFDYKKIILEDPNCCAVHCWNNLWTAQEKNSYNGNDLYSYLQDEFL